MKVHLVLEYNGVQYSFAPDDCEYDEFEQAEFMWTEGNFSCDCNKSLFIQRQCDESFPDLECGDNIKLVRMEPI